MKPATSLRLQTDRGLDTSEKDFLKSLAAQSASFRSPGPDLVHFRIIHVSRIIWSQFGFMEGRVGRYRERRRSEGGSRTA